MRELKTVAQVHDELAQRGNIVCTECLERLQWDAREDAYTDWGGATSCADRVNPEDGLWWSHEAAEFATTEDADSHVQAAREPWMPRATQCHRSDWRH